MFVSINWANITPGFEHNFDQHITDGDDIGAYDFGSIMHYPLTAFSVNGSNTITPIATVPPGVTVGQRNGLSAGDIAAANSLCTPKPVKEGPRDTLKEIRKDVRKEIPFDTRKEMIKDIRLDTRKELILDTIKEQIRDTLKEGIFDPGPTLRENVVTPGRPVVVQPRPVTTIPVGAQPFAVVTPHQAALMPADTAGLQDSIAQLDAQLQQLADQLAQTEAAKETLQAQYNETSVLLAQLIQEHDQSTE